MLESRMNSKKRMKEAEYINIFFKKIILKKQMIKKNHLKELLDHLLLTLLFLEIRMKLKKR